MVHVLLEMWQGSQNLHATQNESHASNNQKTVVGYISNIEEIVTAFLSKIQHNSAAGFQLSEQSHLPPAVPAKEPPWRTN